MDMSGKGKRECLVHSERSMARRKRRTADCGLLTVSIILAISFFLVFLNHLRIGECEVHPSTPASLFRWFHRSFRREISEFPPFCWKDRLIRHLQLYLGSQKSGKIHHRFCRDSVGWKELQDRSDKYYSRCWRKTRDSSCSFGKRVCPEERAARKGSFHRDGGG